MATNVLVQDQSSVLPGVPVSTVKPVFSGPHWHLNAGLWFARWILAEGRMRAIFSMLFGAGVLLMTGRAEERGCGVRTADILYVVGCAGVEGAPGASGRTYKACTYDPATQTPCTAADAIVTDPAAALPRSAPTLDLAEPRNSATTSAGRKTGKQRVTLWFAN